MSAKILSGRPIKNPIERRSLGQFFFNSAEKFSSRICQIDATIDETETYASVKLRSTRIAIALQKRGITSNDVIALCSSNTLNNTIPMLGAFYLGVKVANLEVSLSMRHTKHLLKLVTPKIIFVETSALPLIKESLEGAKFSTEIIVFERSSNHTTFSDLVQPHPDEGNFRPLDVDIHDTAIMFFSSGTTGLPKAICHSHYSIMCTTEPLSQIGIVNTLFHHTSFYWATAMYMLTCSFKDGSPRVFTRNTSGEFLFRIMEKYQVSAMFLAPIITYNLTSFEKAKQYNTSSVKFIVLRGSSITPLQYHAVSNLFKNAVVICGYGMSEAGVVAAFDYELDKDIVNNKIGSCGKPAPGSYLKIVDLNNSKVLGPNQKGEICVKSPALMKGYYRADCSHVYDNDGFLKTGDIGHYDEDDCVYLEGRIKEMFKYQSWHIVPSSVEAVLLEHPGIKEAVVFGIPHGEDGEVPAACLVKKEGFNVNEEDINMFLAGKATDREKLRGGITFLKQLPKTPTGKVMRKEVRDMILQSLSESP